MGHVGGLCGSQMLETGEQSEAWWNASSELVFSQGTAEAYQEVIWIGEEARKKKEALCWWLEGKPLPGHRGSQAD